MTRYLSGLLSCALGLCGGGWLIAAAVLLGGAPTDGTLVSLGTGAGIALVSAVGIGCWAVAWRARMRLDGVLVVRNLPLSRGQARRNRRALRKDMRRATRQARRPAKLEEKRPCCVPAPRAPTPDEAAGGPAGGRERSAVLLSELRAILEPLLTAGPLDAPLAGSRDTSAGSRDAALDGEEAW
jgi:hypothetical protein